jgi:hypothetical protein
MTFVHMYTPKLSCMLQVRPISFDIVMSVCVVAYLLGLLIFLQGPAEAKNTLRDIFKGKSSKQLRSNKGKN